MMRYGKYSILVLLLVTSNACAPDYFSAEKTAERREAVELRKAAEAGDAEAQFELANCYIHGTGLREDFEQAAVWYRKAAEQGNMLAQFALGHSYAYGHGVRKDMSQAAVWFRKAAEQGHVDAQCRLGTILSDCEGIYSNCQGITRDLGEAVVWFRKAAEQGDGFGMCMLGALYAQGDEIPRDVVAAYQWFDLGAAHGWESTAAPRRDELSEEMTPEQIAEGERRAAEFLAARETGGE